MTLADTQWQVGDLALALAGPDAVVCADDDPSVCEGEILRVDKIISWMHQTGLCFDGRPSGHATGAYDANYFRKILSDRAEGNLSDWEILLDNMKQPQPVETEARHD